MNTRVSKEQQFFYVMAHTQRWTNIGLSILFFFMGLFVYIFLKTDLPNWWINLTDNQMFSYAFDVLLFIPVAVLLLICISFFIVINNVIGRILLLVCFSFLMSVFLVFVVCAALKLWSFYSVCIFFLYTIIVLFTLYFLDAIILSTICIDGAIAIPIVKTILSLPIVFIIWKITGIGWVWLICLQVFILYFFFSIKTSFTWAKINKLYTGGYTFICHKGKVEMFKNSTYRKVGLYFTLYNYLENVFMVLNKDVNNLDSVTDGVNESLENQQVSEILAEFVDDNPSNYGTHSEMTFPIKFQGKKMLLLGLLFYVLVAVSIYWAGTI